MLIHGVLGKFCEIELSAHVCDNNPCRNNGTCKFISGGKNYECNCAPGMYKLFIIFCVRKQFTIFKTLVFKLYLL